MKKILLMIVVISVLLSTVSVDVFATGNIAEKMHEEGITYFVNKDYDRAFARFQISGEEKGYAPAQNMLGICYRDGLGTEQSLEEAERFFKRAAEQGNSDAAANLASMDQEKEEAYQDAINLYLDGKYAEAIITFEALNGYKRSEDFLAAMMPTQSPTPTLSSVLIPQNPYSPYGKALRENLINGVYYSDAQKVNIVTETFQNRKNSEGIHRAWYYGTFRDDIYLGYRVELYYADGLLFFANVTKNSKNQVTLHYWDDQIIACRDLRGYDTAVSYAGSTVYEAVNMEFGNLYSIALKYAP